MRRPPPILNASTNLLGICFVIIGGLKLSGANRRSYADGAAWAAAMLLFTAALTAYLAICSHGARPRQIRVADVAFLAGMTVLAAAVFILVAWL